MTTEKAAPTQRVDAVALSDVIVRQSRLLGADRYAEIVELARQLERESIRLAERLKEAREALEGVWALYSHVWDRVDGCLVVMPTSVDKFDAAFEKCRDTLRSGEGE